MSQSRLNPSDVKRRSLAPRLWAACIAVLFIHLATQAVAPLVRSWDVRDLAQEGQLTVFNNVPDGGYFGVPVEIADWDGDGRTDLAVAPMRTSSGPEGTRLEGGVVQLHKGTGEISGVVDAAEQPVGLTLWGARPGDQLGTELFSADLNGDGVEDLILGAQNHDGPDRGCTNCGAVYVLFGNPRLFDEPGRVIDTAFPNPDVMPIYGGAHGGRLGIWVEAGDLDGDGLADLVMGSDQASVDGGTGEPNPAEADPEDHHRGVVVVLYGRETFPASIQLDSRQASDLPGVARLLGPDAEDHFGASLHCVDLNDDGLDELVVGSALDRRSATIGQERDVLAHNGQGGDGPDETRENTGETILIFSRSDDRRLPPLLDLRDPPAGFADRITYIYGDDPNEMCGEEITSGDFDGDGQQDLVVGALRGRNLEGRDYAGKAYVLYWRTGLEGVEIDLAESGAGQVSPGVRVSVLYGLNRPDILGDTLSAADFNHDGIDDLAVGIPNTSVAGRSAAGMVALVYGQSSYWPDLWAPQAQDVPAELKISYILGADARDLLSYSMEARDHDGDGYADLFSNAMQGDGGDNQHEDAGEAYLISGYRLSGTQLALTNVVPATGPLGAPIPVRLVGDGFTTKSDLTVAIDGQALDDLTVVDGQEVGVTLPPSSSVGPVAVTVTTRYGAVTLENAFTYVTDGSFVRGDTDLDLRLTIVDAIVILEFLFGPGRLRCRDAGDSDDNGSVDIADAVYVLAFLFGDGSPPPAPFPTPGSDETADELGCEAAR